MFHYKVEPGPFLDIFRYQWYVAVIDLMICDDPASYTQSYITNLHVYLTVSDGKVFSFIKTFVSQWWISVRNVLENISLMWARDAFKLMNKSLMQKTKCKQNFLMFLLTTASTRRAELIVIF